MTNTAAQQRRRRARKKAGITLRTNRPRFSLAKLNLNTHNRAKKR